MTTGKRVALYHNLPAGGALRHTAEQVRGLVQRGWEVQEFTQSTADCSFMPMDQHTTHRTVQTLRWMDLSQCPIRGLGPYLHFVINGLNLRRLNERANALASTINRSGCGVALVKDCRYVIAPFILRYLRMPAVFYMHSDPRFRSAREWQLEGSRVERIRRLPGRWHEALVYRQFRANLAGAQRVLTNSRFSRERIQRRHGVTAHVVYPGVDVRTFCPRAGRIDAPYFISAGALLRRKGHWFVVDALALLPVKDRPKLVVATPLPDGRQATELAAYGARRGVRVDVDCVRDGGQLAELYSGAVALLFAPEDEGLGLVALEAMACGTPVVGVAEGGLVETVRDGETGFLVGRDVAQFSAAANLLLRRGDLRRTLGEQGRTWIGRFWTWARAVNELEEHLEMFNCGASSVHAAR